MALALVAVAGGSTVWLRAAPSVGMASATPAYIVINTPTALLITVRITDASLLPNGVNLLRTDANGKTIAILGVMHDDGINGDALPRDQVCSFCLTANEPAVGKTYYQASAAFKGVLKRALSSPVIVTVDPFRLPPDPGEAGKQTLAGVDSDQDGVRDDVQRYIAFKYPQSERTRAALSQAARAFQFEIVAGGNGQQVHDAHDCMDSIFMTGPADVTGGRLAYDAKRSLEAAVLNTPARVKADFQATSGVAIVRSTPYSDKRTHCTFDPSTLPN